jgi:hypothetical protein
MKTNVLTMLALAMLFSFLSCNEESADNDADKATEETAKIANSEEEVNTNGEMDFSVSDSQSFISIISDEEGMPRTWESDDDSPYAYFFFRPDGSMAGGGEGGEESMWEAKWEFVSGQLTVKPTMQASDGTQALSGTYKVSYFPDDSALTVGERDYYLSEY